MEEDETLGKANMIRSVSRNDPVHSQGASLASQVLGLDDFEPEALPGVGDSVIEMP
jgi:hypothetical protein